MKRTNGVRIGERLKASLALILLAALLLPSAVSFAEGGMKGLPSLHALGGDWDFSGPAITSSGRGDVFALSETEVTDFIFEADVEFTARKGAASLVFFSGSDPSRGSYVANIDLNGNNARLFKFESTGGATTKGEFSLPSDMRDRSSFRLRVEVENGEILYLIEGRPVVTVNDPSAKPGRKLGLLTYDSSVTYSNVGYAEITESTAKITAVSGGNVTFDGSLISNARTDFGAKSIDFALVASKGLVSAELFGGSDEKVAVSDGKVTVQSPSSDFTLCITLTDGGFMRHYVIHVAVDPDPATVYNEEQRSQFHFSPLKNWMNDPNGLVYDPSDGKYHLFFQYNPYGLNIANQVWGHAESADLVHWKELGIAIPQDHLGAVYSGSAVVDENNTSGFFTDNEAGQSRLVAVYTADGGDTTHGVEKQCIAYSKDHGVTWIKPSLEKDGVENPVIPNDENGFGRDFRDPKVFWYDGKWFMAVAGGRARLFTSSDLKHWTQVCDMGFDSECPDFYPLPVDGDREIVKWVYTASGKWYVIGRLEKNSESNYTFVAEGDRTPYNGGNEVYATQSYFNDGSGTGRRIAISWIQDSSASAVPGKGWNGVYTLPYEQTLKTVRGKIILCSYPVTEVETLRKSQIIDLSSPDADEANEALAADPGVAFDSEIVFKADETSRLTFTVRSSGSCCTNVVYDGANHTVGVVRSLSGSANGSVPKGSMEMPLYPDKNGQITLRVVVDRSVIEVFGNEGEAACAGSIFPDPDCVNCSLSVSGSVEIRSLKTWRMGSAWHGDSEILPTEGIYFESDAPAVVSTECDTVLTAYYIGGDGRRTDSGLNWDAPTSDAVRVVSNEGGVLILRGLKKGSVTLTARYGNTSGSITLPVAAIRFDTNLEGWTGGDWYVSADGYSIPGSDGDSFAFSAVRTDGAFTYSGEARFTAGGGCLGLVFGTDDPSDPKSATWYGANVDTHSSKPQMKLFCNRSGQEIWRETDTFSASADLWKLEVRYGSDGTITYTVNGRSVTHTVNGLKGGLGLVSWNGGGSFNNVNYTPFGAAPGDPDGDGRITSTDARLALQIAVNKIEAADVAYPDAADADGDGGITSTDARLILQRSVNKISRLPAEPEAAVVRETPLREEGAEMNVRISQLPGEDPYVILPGGAADPFVTFCAETDYYYSLATHDSVIEIRRSKYLEGLFETGESRVVYETGPVILESMWAPEMHFMDGHWYIYSSGRIFMTSYDKHMFVLESKTADPFDGFEFKGYLDNSVYGIDPTVYADAQSGKRYIAFSQVLNGYQYISIAELITPWKMGDPVTVSDPTEYEWESTTDGPLNEGPFFVKHGERLFLIYSANGCFSDSYCLGLLEYTGQEMLNRDSWEKYPRPIFQKNEAGGIYAPGHASFFYSPDRTELWMAYHCYYSPNADKRVRMRICQVQKVEFDGTGFPVLGEPLPEGTRIPVPSGE